MEKNFLLEIVCNYVCAPVLLNLPLRPLFDALLVSLHGLYFLAWRILSCTLELLGKRAGAEKR